MAISKQRPKKRVLVVDDHPVMRQGLAQVINQEPDLMVCGEADTASQALNSIAAREPDIVVTDLSLPDKSGIELIKDIRVYHPNLPVLAFSTHDESLFAERVLRAGGRGYLMKQEPASILVQAIREVLGGQIYVSHKMSARILEIFSGRRSEGVESPVESLSDREFEIFQLIGRGCSSADMAERLHISVKTVEVHRGNIRRKLKLKHATELVRCAVRWIEADNGGRV